MKEIMGPQGVKGLLLDIFYSVLGSALVALGVAVFTVPNDIAPGGVSGLATALAYISPISVGATVSESPSRSPPAPFASVGTISSTNVFQAPHPGHFPIHFADSAPQSWQTNTVFRFFPAI